MTSVNVSEGVNGLTDGMVRSFQRHGQWAEMGPYRKSWLNGSMVGLMEEENNGTKQEGLGEGKVWTKVE